MSRVANGSNNRASSAASFPRYLDTTALLGQSVHLKWVGGRNSQGQTVQGELMLGHRKNGEAIFLLRGKTPDINYVLPGIRDLKGAEQAARRLIKTERNLELSALPEQHAALPELRPYRGKLAGHEVNAEPLHTDNGKTTWRITVSSKGKDETLGHFDIRLPSAPLSAQHFTNGTPLKNRLLKFIHEHQPRVQVAGVKANNGRPAERIAGGLTASILNEQTGVTTTVRLPLYKRPDQGFLGLRGYYTIVRGECIELPTAASPEAAQGRGHELIERLLKQGRIDPKSMSVSQTHRIVTDSKGQKRAVPLANQTARDGALMFDAYVAADLSTEKAPKGTKAFVEGWNQRRGVINAARALQVATTILAVAGSVPLRRPLVGTNVQTPRTQPKPTGTIEVSLPLAMSPVNGGRTPQQPRPVGPPVALCPSKNTVIPPRKLTDAAIDVQATTVSSTVIPPRAEIPRRPGDAVVRAVDYLRPPARAGSPSSSSNTVGVTGRNNTPSAALAKRSTGGLNASPTQLLTTGSRNSGSKPLVSHRQRTPVPQQGRSSSLSNFHGTPTEPNTLKAVGSTPNVVDLMPRPLPLRLQLALTQLENSSDNMPALTSNTAATVPRSSEGTGQLTQPRQDFHNSSEKAIPFVQELLKVKNLSPAQIDLVLQRLQNLEPSAHHYVMGQLVQALAGETQDNESDRSPILLPVLARYWARGDKKLVPILERVLQGRDEAGLRLLLPDAEGKPGEAVIQALISARALQLAGEKSKPDYVIALGHILRLQLGLQSDQDVGSQVQWLLNLQNSPDRTRHIRLSALKQLQDDRDRRQVTAHTPAAIGNVTQLRSASGSGTQQPPRPINNQDWQEMGSLFLPRGTSPSPAITKIRSASNISELNSRLDKLRENPGFKIWLKKPETLAEIEKSLKKIHGAGYSESSWLDLGSDVLQARLIQHLEAGTTEALLENWLGLESDQTPEHLVKLIEDKPDLLHALVQTVLQPKLEPKWLALGAENLQKLRRTLEMLWHSGYNQRTLERSANRDAALHGAISQSDRDHPDAVGKLTRWVSQTQGTLWRLVDGSGEPLSSRGSNVILRTGATAPQQARNVPDFDWRDFGIHGTGTQVHIADAHGNYDALRAIILNLSRWGVRDLRLSQLGDLINKGWDGEACVRLTISLSEIAKTNGSAFPSSVTQRYQEKDTELLRALHQLHSNGLSFVPHAGNHEQIANQGAQGGYARHLQAVDPADVPGYLEKIRKWMKVGGRSTVVSYIERYATPEEATNVRGFLDNLPVAMNIDGKDFLSPEDLERVNRFSEIWLGVLRKAGHLDFLGTELKLGAMEGSVITTHGGAQLNEAEAREFLDYANGKLNNLSAGTAHSLLWQRPFGKGNVAELYAQIFGEDKVIIHGHTPHANHIVSYDPNTGVVVIGADLGFTSEQVGFVVINNGQIALGAAKRGPSGISVQPVSWDSVAGTGVSTLSNRVTEVPPGELFEKKKVTPPAETPAASAPTTLQTYQQHQQQPQQGRRSGGQESTADIQRRLGRVLRLPSHLKIMNSADGLSISLNSDGNGGRVAETALTVLQREHNLSALAVQRMLTPLLLGRIEADTGRKLIGLEALCDYWQKVHSHQPLTLDILRQLGRIIYNNANYGDNNQLTGLESLVGFVSDKNGYSGIYPLNSHWTGALNWLQPFNSSEGYMQNLLANLGTDKAIPLLEASALRDSLGQLSWRIDESLQDEFMPWLGSRSSAYVSSLQNYHAYASTLWSTPNPDTLDWSTAYPRQLKLVRDVYNYKLLPVNNKEPHRQPVVDHALPLQLAANAVAEKYFPDNPAYQTRLFYYLSRLHDTNLVTDEKFLTQIIKPMLFDELRAKLGIQDGITKHHVTAFIEQGIRNEVESSQLSELDALMKLLKDEGFFDQLILRANYFPRLMQELEAKIRTSLASSPEKKIAHIGSADIYDYLVHLLEKYDLPTVLHRDEGAAKLLVNLGPNSIGGTIVNNLLKEITEQLTRSGFSLQYQITHLQN